MPVEAPINNLALVSMILGIISMLGLGLVTGIPAIITGIVALKQKAGERSMGIAGIVMGSIATALSLLFILLITLVVILLISEGEYHTPPEQQYWIQSSET